MLIHGSELLFLAMREEAFLCLRRDAQPRVILCSPTRNVRSPMRNIRSAMGNICSASLNINIQAAGILLQGDKTIPTKGVRRNPF
jgi:hypothetical protein